MLGKKIHVRFRWSLFVVGLVLFVGALVLMILAASTTDRPPFISGPWVLLSIPLVIGLACMVLSIYEYLERRHEEGEPFHIPVTIDWKNFAMGSVAIALGWLLLSDYCVLHCSNPVISLVSDLTDLGLRMLVLIGGMIWFVYSFKKRGKR